MVTAGVHEAPSPPRAPLHRTPHSPSVPSSQFLVVPSLAQSYRWNRCSGQYDRYTSHCTCDSGWTGAKCDTKASPSPSPPSSGGASSGGEFTVTSGPCTTTEGGSCVSRLHYGNNEQCEIRANGDAQISSCPSFDIEAGFDFLNIAGTNYDGTNCPSGVLLHDGTSIRWMSDASDTSEGWEICTAGGSSSSSRPPPPPSPAAPSCPSGERDCGKHAGCGWCISDTYDSGCLPSNEFGVM